MNEPMGDTSSMDADADPQGIQVTAVDLLHAQKRPRRSSAVHGSTANRSKQDQPVVPGLSPAVTYHPTSSSSQQVPSSVPKDFALSYAGFGAYGPPYATSPPFPIDGSYVTPYGSLPTQPYYYSGTSNQLQMLAYANGLPYHATASNSAVTDYMPSDLKDAPYELLDPQYAEAGASVDSMDGTTTDLNYYLLDGSNHLQLQSLPILESLADRLLSTLTLSSLSEVLTAVSNPETGQGQAFATLLSLFIQNKQLYSRDQPFLDAHALRLNQPECHKVLRKTNLATFISTFCGPRPNLIQLHDHFLSIFVPLGHRLLDWQGSLFIELKTQVYIVAAMRGSDPRQKTLDELFPDNLEAQIMARHPGSQQVTPNERGFLGAAFKRKQELYNMASADARILSQKYRWRAFLDEVGRCVQKCLEEMQNNHIQISPQPVQPFPAFGQVPQNYHSPYFIPTSDSMEMSSTLSGDSMSGDTLDHQSDASSVTITAEQSNASTQALYERARQTTSGRPSPTNYRRTAAPTQRRPWSVEEEKALMDGLDRVKGPHWSQILALYGAGGSISEVLKERNQVQLKDKARNLKLFFLKSGIDVPYYLQSVTGELKTRAPAQAAKREALKASKSKEKGEAEVARIIAAAPPSLADMVAGALQGPRKQQGGYTQDWNPVQQSGAGDRSGQQQAQSGAQTDTG